MRPAAEAMVEALLVVDGEARRLLVVERAARLPLADGVAVAFEVAEELSILHAVDATPIAHMITRKNFISEAIIA